MQTMMRVGKFSALRMAATTVTTVLLLSATNCKKKPAPAAPGANGAIPAIATSNTSFDADRGAWLAAMQANDNNISAGAGQSFAHVTYKPEVKKVNQSDVDSSLLGMSTDGHGAVFLHPSASIAALKAGDVLMVPNQFAVRVLGAQNDSDGTTTIVFDRAGLKDIIAQGQIHLDTPISFHGQQTAQAAPQRKPFHLMDLVDTPVYAQNGTGTPPAPGQFQPGYNTPKPGVNGGSASDQASAFAKALLSGWTVAEWNITPGASTASINGKFTKDIGGFLALVTMNGTVSNFQFTQDISFPVNSTQVIGGVKGMTGQMTFGWEIGKNTPGVWATEDKLKLPAGVAIPLAEMLDGIPVVLDISAALLIHPGLTGGNEYSKGSFTVGWNSSATSEGLTFTINQDQNISPVAPNAMVIAFCVPRVELQVSPMGMFGSTADAKPFANVPGLSAFLGGKSVKDLGSMIDSKVASLAQSVLSPTLLAAIQKSPLGNFSISNTLSSQADVYVQMIHTQGTTHSATVTPMPCSRIDIKVDGQVGGDAQLFGLTPGASTVKTIFTKTFTRWDPASDFCKSVGSGT
jgi:hypothetical protein